MSVCLCVEDTAGHTRNVKLYNYPGTRLAPTTVLNTLFPIGCILAIREPKGDSVGDMRVDSPSDVTLVRSIDAIARDVIWKFPVPNSDTSSRTKEEWVSLGEAHAKSGEIYASAFSYTRALDFGAETADLRNRRAFTYNELQYRSAALFDANATLSIKGMSLQDRVTALTCAAHAEYGLGRYQTALHHFEECFALMPREENLIRTFMGSCRDRIQESRGNYDWEKMFEEAQTPGGRLDAAEFVGPMKIQAMPHRGGGRGVVTTRFVKAGELIVSIIFLSIEGEAHIFLLVIAIARFEGLRCVVPR